MYFEPLKNYLRKLSLKLSTSETLYVRADENLPGPLILTINITINFGEINFRCPVLTRLLCASNITKQVCEK